MLKRLHCLYLDILTIPTVFMSKKKSAEYHIKHICSRCPLFRRKTADVNNVGDCWWYLNWKRKRYDLPRHFGVRNKITQYLFLRTDLSKFK